MPKEKAFLSLPASFLPRNSSYTSVQSRSWRSRLSTMDRGTNATQDAPDGQSAILGPGSTGHWPARQRPAADSNQPCLLLAAQATLTRTMPMKAWPVTLRPHLHAMSQPHSPCRPGRPVLGQSAAHTRRPSPNVTQSSGPSLLRSHTPVWLLQPLSSNRQVRRCRWRTAERLRVWDVNYCISQHQGQSFEYNKYLMNHVWAKWNLSR